MVRNFAKISPKIIFTKIIPVKVTINKGEYRI